MSNYKGSYYLGDIPNSWRYEKLKWNMFEIKEKNDPVKTDYILSLLKDKGVIPYNEKGEQGNKSKDNLTDYKLAYKKDIVINSMNFSIGSVGISNYYGAVSPAYHVLRVNESQCNLRFINYLFQTKPFQKYASLYGKGILEIRERISAKDFLNLLFPKPSIQVQNRIAKLLDHKCFIINQEIEKNKKSIELMEEYRLSMITDKIRFGFNNHENVKSKSNWIKVTPKAWTEKRLRFLAKVDRGTIDKNLKDDEIPVKLIPYTNIYRNREQRVNNEEFIDISVTKNELTNGQVYVGDVLLTASSETANDIGHSSVIMENMSGYVFGSDILRIHFYDDMHKNYLKYVFENNLYLCWMESLCRGTTRFRFSMNDFKNMIFSIPSVEEQKEIATYLDEKCSLIDKVIDYRKQLIEKLEEYKKSLIYEAVTGKIEV